VLDTPHKGGAQLGLALLEVGEEGRGDQTIGRRRLGWRPGRRLGRRKRCQRRNLIGSKGRFVELTPLLVHCCTHFTGQEIAEVHVLAIPLVLLLVKMNGSAGCRPNFVHKVLFPQRRQNHLPAARLFAGNPTASNGTKGTSAPKTRTLGLSLAIV
jgi:hypothetical protein